VIGILLSFPNALGVILMPGGDWRRLYSLLSTREITLRTSFPRKPAAIISCAEASSSTYNFSIGSSTE